MKLLDKISNKATQLLSKDIDSFDYVVVNAETFEQLRMEYVQTYEVDGPTDRDIEDILCAKVLISLTDIKNGEFEFCKRLRTGT